ncbi:MAG: phosphate/phosphite/phosphonate ABC transporter substrate-binding protein, partial [Gammaproteobacteria bacterium]|nr:phosphate/phosphite/phosphonate ABC transporter substrate-binding protein [Gammaproteobacteria bacterium]
MKGWWILAGVLWVITARAAEPAMIEFGVLPVLSTRSNITLYEPLRDYLERRVGKKVVLTTAIDYRSYVARTQHREFQYLVTAPHFARLAQVGAGYRPMVRVKRDQLALLLT